MRHAPGWVTHNWAGLWHLKRKILKISGVLVLGPGFHSCVHD
uniref:Uncharacterized protein n=1 Tax=Arundo donax TaxID=35708 RepID=A0A0A9BDC3_ARUDO